MLLGSYSFLKKKITNLCICLENWTGFVNKNGMHVFVSKCTCLTSAWLPAGLIGINTWGGGGWGGGGVGGNSKVAAQQQKQAPPSSVPSQVMLCISNHPAKKKKKKSPRYHFSVRFLTPRPVVVSFR